MLSHDQQSRQMVSFSEDRRLKPIPSSKVTSHKTLLSENSLLRDQVEKERFRRKVSDDHHLHVVSPGCVHNQLSIISCLSNLS